MNSKKVKAHLVSFSLSGSVPAPLVILQGLYGLTATDIATSINRSPNQMTYYRNGSTPLPDKVKERLKRMMVDAVAIVDTMESTSDEQDNLLTAISDLTHRAIEAM